MKKVICSCFSKIFPSEESDFVQHVDRISQNFNFKNLVLFSFVFYI